MKRVAFLIATAFILSISLSSCMKTRICECRSVSNPGLNENIEVGPGSKKNAESECENYQFNQSISTPDYTCNLQ